MSWKYSIKIEGKRHTTSKRSEYNRLVKYKKIIAFLIANDLDYSKAIEKFDYSATSTLRVALKKIGFNKTKTTYGELTKQQVIQAIYRHQKGESVKDIAAEYKVTPERLGGRMRMRGYSITDQKFIKAMYETEPPVENKYKALYDRILYNPSLSFV